MHAPSPRWVTITTAVSIIDPDRTTISPCSRFDTLSRCPFRFRVSTMVYEALGKFSSARTRRYNDALRKISNRRFSPENRCECLEHGHRVLRILRFLNSGEGMQRKPPLRRYTPSKETRCIIDLSSRVPKRPLLDYRGLFVESRQPNVFFRSD